MTVIEKELVYEVRQRVREVVAGIDGRLAMQYALAVVCVQEVS
ncbi:hypothetical protein SPONL_1542 [uncultured Candidatus Thioglobus sp.]|nr:hypothetical protein SPONL_1542 [uncultured Candidatus Thioglobus sp.]